MKTRTTFYRSPSLFADFDSLFDSMNNFHRVESRSPHWNFEETDEDFLVFIDIPGVEEKDIQLEVEDQVLSLKAGSESENNQGISKRSYAHTVKLPRLVDEDSLEAQYVNGVLEIRIPKSERAKKRKISLRPEKDSFLKRLLAPTQPDQAS